MKVLFLFLICPLIFFSQEVPEKARLKSAIDTTKTVKNKVQLYADLAWEYISEENDSALVIADKALKFSKQNKYPLGEAIALETKGLYHEIATGNYNLASQFYFEGIAICEKNNLNYQSSIYHSLGVMFHTSDNYEKASLYYKKAYELASKSKDSVLIKKCLINLGSINSSLGNYDKAVELMEQSLDINLRKEMDYATYCNLGHLYIKQGKYDKALPYLLKATEQHPDNPDSEINLYFLLYLKAVSKDTTNMKPVLKRAKVALTDVVGLRNKSLLLRNLADYYKSTGNYKDALYYRDEYIQVFEEIKEKQRDETVYELETKYQTEKKDAELKLLKLESEKKEQQKKLYLILALSGLVIASLVGIFGYKNQQKKIVLAKQKQQLEVAIEEKNMLFREIHHRVKNSLQMVSSLLFLQSENAKDKEAKTAIKDAQNRVRSLGLIHQKLYSKNHVVGVDTKEYIEDLTVDIFNSHQIQSQDLNYKLNIESMILSVDTMTPIGLILNELIVNVLKHAFKEVTPDSLLTIDFYKDNKILLLRVADNGIGFKGNVSDRSFGLILINSLSGKLDATFNIQAKDAQGTEATLIINDFELLDS